MIGALVAGRATSILAVRFTDLPSLVGDPTSTEPHLPWDTILIVGCIVAVVGTIVYLLRTVRNWTGESQVQDWASQHGMSYSARNDALSLNWPEPPFGYAARTCFNVVNGRYRGRHTTMFDLGDRSSSSTTSRLVFADNTDLQKQVRGHVAAVTAMDLPFFIESDLTLRPLKGISRLWAHDSGQTFIELENEDFNRRYDVICTDRDLAYAFFTPRTIEVLLTQPPVEIRVRGVQVLLLDDKPMRPDRMNRWLATLSAVVENVSPFVWTDRGTALAAEVADERVADYEGWTAAD